MQEVSARAGTVQSAHDIDENKYLQGKAKAGRARVFSLTAQRVICTNQNTRNFIQT